MMGMEIDSPSSPHFCVGNHTYLDMCIFLKYHAEHISSVESLFMIHLIIHKSSIIR